ncbi:DUF4376 domain-containing protein [Pseudorhodoferax soli]|uniref:Uncharacterized protein DUF4376 n=1 Tax=Pseudorhodoferax soli TaxID=545864 RepID=A0A368Y3B6_9BURK|nr:DUF4376 domain-containing protein [Pseudorhodoferax soli]RCW73798.1 uncharacterized protein DUF4376 [Pseudorhodoferax soli]
MSYWVEHDGGLVLLAMSGGGEPHAQMGGTVAEVEALCDPAQCLYLDGEVLDLGPAPSFRHVRDAEMRAWVVPGVSALALAQDAKWAEIKAERNRLETAGFPYMGKVVDSDAESALRITGATSAAQAALAIGAPFSIDWTCQDNTVLALDASQMVGMLVALAQHADHLHQVSRTLRAAIYAEDATEASVAAVAWPSE